MVVHDTYVLGITSVLALSLDPSGPGPNLAPGGPKGPVLRVFLLEDRVTGPDPSFFPLA